MFHLTHVFVLIQKNDYTMKLIKEWLYWILFPDCAATYQTKENKKVNPNFVIGLDDQSVLDLLIKRDNLKQLGNKRDLKHADKNIFSHLNNILVT